MFESLIAINIELASIAKAICKPLEILAATMFTIILLFSYVIVCHNAEVVAAIKACNTKTIIYKDEREQK